MIVHIDTSSLFDALTGPRRSLDGLVRLVDEGHRIAVSSIALYEWWRGPRTRAELAVQPELLPAEAAVAFGPAEAAVAARLYSELPRARGREVDVAIAACAIAHGAALWTLSIGDFRDIPGPRLIRRPASARALIALVLDLVEGLTLADGFVKGAIAMGHRRRTLTSFCASSARSSVTSVRSNTCAVATRKRSTGSR